MRSAYLKRNSCIPEGFDGPNEAITKTQARIKCDFELLAIMFKCAEQEKEELVRSAYVTAEALVKRCLGNSHRLWNQMARWSQMSAPRQSAYAMTKSPPRRSASMSDAPLGGEPALCPPPPALVCFHL